MPTRWLPWPGKQERHAARLRCALGVGRAPSKPAGSAPVRSRSVETLARTAASAAASRATSASRAGAPASKASWLARARPSIAAPRPARSAASEAAARTAPARGAREQQELRGQRQAAGRAVGAAILLHRDVGVGAAEAEGREPGAAGARPPRSRGGRRCWGGRGSPRRRAPRWGRPTLIVGGRTPWLSAVTTFNSDTAPAEVLGCPIKDFTEPSAARRVRSGPPNTRVMERTSVASPSSVPVPCASISPTVSGP